MLKLTFKLVSSTLVAVALLNSATALAQDSRWFRVELMVFANLASAPPQGAASPEQWDATPTLAYPSASRFLVDPVQVAGNRAEFGGESLVDEYGRQIITILTQSPTFTDPAAGQPAPGVNAAAPQPAAAQPANPEALTPPTAPAPLSPVYAEATQPAAASELPRPFVLLPRSYQEFGARAATMQRSGRYAVLFHESWVQPVGPEANSLPIVLDRSGDMQQWPQLQGSVKLYLSRYLHIQTNLWLNTAGEYLPGTWRMPAPPFGPPSLIIEEEELVDVASAMGDLPAADSPAGDAGTAVVAVTAAGDDVTAMALEPGADPQLAAETVAAAEPVYPYRHAILLERTGRMRSGEIHYVDHPKLGVVIKFTPVTAEQLAEIAQQQAGLL